jgi:membrane protein DedA with SNARE-associated domain
MFIGIALWVAGLLVLFFLPAADRSGQQGTFHAIIALLVFSGAVLMALGWWKRRRSTTE